MRKLALTLTVLFAAATTVTASLKSFIEETQTKVVKIGLVGKEGSGVCSGSFITESGLVLTCAHCFDHEGILKVFIKTSDGKAYRAALVTKDDTRDLALVVPESIGPFPHFDLGVVPYIGQKVFSFGSPLGLQGTVTQGWVSNYMKQQKRIVFHSAFIAPGNSGGPLVNRFGELVGVNEFVANYGFLQVAQGLYGAISVSEVKDWLKELHTQAKRKK